MNYSLVEEKQYNHKCVHVDCDVQLLQCFGLFDTVIFEDFRSCNYTFLFLNLVTLLLYY